MTYFPATLQRLKIRIHVIADRIAAGEIEGPCSKGLYSYVPFCLVMTSESVTNVDDGFLSIVFDHVGTYLVRKKGGAVAPPFDAEAQLVWLMSAALNWVLSTVRYYLHHHGYATMSPYVAMFTLYHNNSTARRYARHTCKLQVEITRGICPSPTTHSPSGRQPASQLASQPATRRRCPTSRKEMTPPGARGDDWPS